MPELAEVEFYRKRWHQAAVGERVTRVLTHDTKKLLRELGQMGYTRQLQGTGGQQIVVFLHPTEKPTLPLGRALTFGRGWHPRPL